MHAQDRRQRSERPGQFVHVGVELQPHRARPVDLRVLDPVGVVDVAKPGELAELVVERNEHETEAEHDDDDDDELD